VASRDHDPGSDINTPLSNAAPASSPEAAESVQESESRATGFDAKTSDIPSAADELAPGAQIQQSAPPQRIEIGIVEGDATIIGGAPQVFLRVLDNSIAEDIVGYNVVRFARLRGGIEFHVPHNVEVTARQIAGNAAILNAPGHVNIGKVDGNLLIVDAPHGLFAEVGGNAVLDTSLGAHAQFVVHAAANITLRTHGEINARFVAQTSQGMIRTRLPLMVERGRRRNLIGVIGQGGATVNLRSEYGNITIIAADYDEREYAMSNEFASDNKEREQEDPRMWEGGFGRYRFRTQWDRGPKHARFGFQGPFTEENDPDGFGVPFSPDFGFEWEQGQGAHVYGEYEERWDDLREKAERAARRAAKQARHYTERAARQMRGGNWEAIEREVLSAVDKAMAELEEALANIRREWSKRRAESQSTKSEQKHKAHRVHIEYENAEDPFAEDSAAGSTGTASPTPLSREERDARRRAILEKLRTGAISIEEAERHLIELG
jgi:hypothetical protein